MPPKRKEQHEDAASLKEKLNSGQASGARGRRNNATNVSNGSHLKEVMNSAADNASTHSGQTDQNASGVSNRTQWDSNSLQKPRR
jgi:hypothetical protein